MAYVNLSTRLPLKDKKAIESIVDEEGLDSSTVTRLLLEKGLVEWKKQKALAMLSDRKISFGKAAEIAGLSLWEFSALVKEKKNTWITIPKQELEKNLNTLEER